jgi:hypothetical protein
MNFDFSYNGGPGFSALGYAMGLWIIWRILRAIISKQKHHNHFPPEHASDRKDINTEAYKKKNYQGSTAGVSWQMTAEMIKTYRSAGGNFRSIVKQRTRWQSSDVRFAHKKFLLIMAMPKKIKINDMKKGGIFNAVINWMAERFLDVYVSGYFGEQYKELVNAEGASIIRFAEIQDFYILSNEPDQAKRLLTSTVIDMLKNWREQTNESNAKALSGVLLTEQNMIVCCQVALLDQAAAGRYAEFAAQLAVSLKQ